jgi:hypothetical protein
MTFIQRFTLAGLGAILACAANAGTPGTRIVEDIGNKAVARRRPGIPG